MVKIVKHIMDDMLGLPCDLSFEFAAKMLPTTHKEVNGGLLMLSIIEALRLMQQCFDTIVHQAAEDYVEAVDVMRCYEDFSENPLDVDALERLVAAFEKWYGDSAMQAVPVANATPGPWQLGEPESKSPNYALAPIWGGCLADPTGRHFIVGYAVLQNGEPTKPLVRWSAKNAAILASSLDLYAAARALLDAECGNMDDIHEAVRLSADAMAKIERASVPILEPVQQ